MVEDFDTLKISYIYLSTITFFVTENEKIQAKLGWFVLEQHLLLYPPPPPPSPIQEEYYNSS